MRSKSARHRAGMSVRLCWIACMCLLAPVLSAFSTSATPAGGSTSSTLIQGAIPNQTNDDPCYLQSIFGNKTSTTPTLGTEYAPAGNGWPGMDGAKDPITGFSSLSFLKPWASPCSQGGNVDHLVLGVPIIPKKNGSAVGTLQGGAAGAYNQYFTQLAETLIGDQLGNTWLRLGWEFDNKGYAWSTDKCGTGTTDSQCATYYAEYFQQIVTTMRAVSGANFRYIWNPDAYAFLGFSNPSANCDLATSEPCDPIYKSPDQYYTNVVGNLTNAWPGAGYVDYIGLDLYDSSGWGPQSNSSPALSWANYIQPQLSEVESFDAQYGGNKPLDFSEWGVCAIEVGQGADCQQGDPLYIENMYKFMTTDANNVAWESYFNISEANPPWNSQITGNGFPTSLMCFEEEFGGVVNGSCP